MKKALNYIPELFVFLVATSIKTAFDVFDVLQSNYYDAKDSWSQRDDGKPSTYDDSRY